MIDDKELLVTKEVKQTDDNASDKIYRKLIKRFVIESMGKYFEEDYIIRKLNSIVKIEMDEENHYNDKTIFEGGILKLPSDFFATDIKQTDDAITLMVDYPYLKDLLTTYGIYILGFNKKDSKETKIIKNIIASYFATENNKGELANIEIGDLTFNGYATSNVLLENIIRELALIFGDNLLAETLTKGTDYLIKQIDEKTRKKGLGKKLVTSLIELVKMNSLERNSFNECEILGRVIDEKLLPMYNKIKQFDIEYQNAILNIIKIHDFDFSIISSIEPDIDLSDIKLLNEPEKSVLRECLKTFDENWKSFSFLIKDYPYVKPIGENDDGDVLYDGESFSFLNKVLSVDEEYLTKHSQICDSLQWNWQDTQGIIITEIIPRYIRYNQNAYIDLSEILTLSKYKTATKKYDLSNKFKIRRLAKRLEK